MDGKIKDGMWIKGRHTNKIRTFYDEKKRKIFSRHSRVQQADEYPDTYNTRTAVWYKAPPL